MTNLRDFLVSFAKYNMSKNILDFQILISKIKNVFRQKKNFKVIFCPQVISFFKT